MSSNDESQGERKAAEFLAHLKEVLLKPSTGEEESRPMVIVKPDRRRRTQTGNPRPEQG